MLDAVRGDAVVGHRIDAAFDLGVMVHVLEGQQLAVVCVDQSFPGSEIPGDLYPDHIGETVGIAAGLSDRRYQDELRFAQVRVAAGEVVLDDVVGLLERQMRLGPDIDRGPAGGPEEDQIAAVGDRGEVTATHRDSTDAPWHVELHHFAAVVDGHSALTGNLGEVETELAMKGVEVGGERLPGDLLQRFRVLRSGQSQILPPQVVADPVAGPQRLYRHQGIPAAAVGVDASTADGNAERLQINPRLSGVGRCQLTHRQVGLGDVEVGMVE